MRASSVVRRRVLVVLLGVSLLAITPALAGRRSATVSAAVGRPDVGSQQPSIAWESTGQMNADLDAMVAAGMTWVRADFYWSAIELQRGRFSWGATDTFVRAAHARPARAGAAGLHAELGALGTDRQVPAARPARLRDLRAGGRAALRADGRARMGDLERAQQRDVLGAARRPGRVHDALEARRCGDQARRSVGDRRDRWTLTGIRRRKQRLTLDVPGADLRARRSRQLRRGGIPPVLVPVRADARRSSGTPSTGLPMCTR